MPTTDRAEIPHFIPKSIGYKMGKIIYGSDRPDIYTTICLEGTVVLKDNPYEDTFKTIKFENFPLFKNGKPVSPRIIVSGKALKVLKIGKANSKGMYGIDLSKISFDCYLQDEYEVYTLCGMYQGEIIDKAMNKVFRYYHNELSPQLIDNNKELKEWFELEYVKVLNENHITDKGFNLVAKSKKKKKDFEIKMKSLSHLPKIEDVLDRIKSGKKHTKSSVLMVSSIELCKRTNVKGIQQLLSMNETSLNFWSKQIREFKYGMFLSGKWFKEFTKKCNQTIVKDDWEFKIVV